MLRAQRLRAGDRLDRWRNWAPRCPLRNLFLRVLLVLRLQQAQRQEIVRREAGVDQRGPRRWREAIVLRDDWWRIEIQPSVRCVLCASAAAEKSRCLGDRALGSDMCW